MLWYALVRMPRYCSNTESAILLLFCCDYCFRGITLFPDFILHNSRCQVLCGSCKKLPRTSIQCCYIFFWSFGIINDSTIECWELSTAQAGARGREEWCSYSLALMYRLNQTESVVINASEGSLCVQNFRCYQSCPFFPTKSHQFLKKQ
jgi:hypothetical protein